MKTIDELKNSVEFDHRELTRNNYKVFIDGMFIEVDSITSVYEDWTLSKINGVFKFKDVLEQHSDLYFERIKLPVPYDKEEVRTVYFILARIHFKLQQIKDAERLCSVFSELGSIDGTKKKLSAVGKYFVNDKELTSNAVSKFQTRYRTKFNPKDIVEFKEAYMLSYNEAKLNYEELKEQNNKSRRHSKDAIAKSYTGDVEELLGWIKNNLEYITVKVPTIQLEDYEDIVTGSKNKQQITVAELKEKVITSTETLVDEAKEQGLVENDFQIETGMGLFAVWALKLRPDAKNNIPDAVKEWTYMKKKSGTLDDYAEGLVYREKKNMLTGNPIIKDLVFGYGLHLQNK